MFELVNYITTHILNWYVFTYINISNIPKKKYS